MSAPIGGTRTTLGPQVSSKKTSAPCYGFGSGTRETQERVFVSKEHAALASGASRSPGPAVYDHLPAVGPQVNGAMESAPRWAFGTDQRFERANRSTFDNPAPGKYDVQPGVGIQASSTKQSMPHYGFGSSTRANQAKVYVTEEHNKTSDYGKNSPGPCAPYTHNPAVGNQVLSYGPNIYGSGPSGSTRNGSQPSWVMGKAQRFDKMSSTDWVPAPGTYSITASVGAQVSSSKPSRPRIGFGTSNREHAAKVYISAEHEKVSGGSKDAPGPGAYPVPSLTGKPVVSGKQVSGSAWGFGTSKRFTDPFKHQAGNPGPGQYVI